MLRFLHGGDFHLDSPFHSLSPKQASKAREEQRDLLYRFHRLARKRSPDLIFLTGDLFDGMRIYPETLNAFREMLEDIPSEIFISPGNHDPYTDTSPYARLSWPTHVHIFRSSQIESVELFHLGCTVFGSAFTAFHRTTPPLDAFSCPGDGLHFGCFHGELTQGMSRYGPISSAQIEASNFHYLALGHIHSSSGLCHAGDTYYAYPGCPQGRGFDETGEKGVLWGTTDGKSVTLDFIPLCSRQYRFFPIDITGQSPEHALRLALPELPTADIVRIILTGKREEDSQLLLPLLHKIASPYFYSVSFLDRTQLSQELWARQKEESLLGLFLREMSRRMEAAESEDLPRLELALRFGLAALEGRESPE
jgi:DNA repair exonuclease SbcCD nuclease subunit